VYTGHNADVVRNVDVVVKSSAVHDDNPEVAVALAQKIPVIRRAEMLSEIMRMSYGIGIAGTHAKPPPPPWWAWCCARPTSTPPSSWAAR
jgi:UDP-N-acetylmuramate--alanine ligase